MISVGNRVEHAAFGMGTVASVGEDFVVIDFVNKANHRMSLALAQKSLKVYPKGGLAARLASDPAEVGGWREKAPLRLLAATLLDIGGPASEAEIRAALERHSLVGKGWRKWWERVSCTALAQPMFSSAPGGKYLFDAKVRIESVPSTPLDSCVTAKGSRPSSPIKKPNDLSEALRNEVARLLAQPQDDESSLVSLASVAAQHPVAVKPFLRPVLESWSLERQLSLVRRVTAVTVETLVKKRDTQGDARDALWRSTRDALSALCYLAQPIATGSDSSGRDAAELVSTLSDLGARVLSVFLNKESEKHVGSLCKVFVPRCVASPKLFRYIGAASEKATAIPLAKAAFGRALLEQVDADSQDTAVRELLWGMLEVNGRVSDEVFVSLVSDTRRAKWLRSTYEALRKSDLMLSRVGLAGLLQLCLSPSGGVPLSERLGLEIAGAVWETENPGWIADMVSRDVEHLLRGARDTDRAAGASGGLLSAVVQAIARGALGAIVEQEGECESRIAEADKERVELQRKVEGLTQEIALTRHERDAIMQEAASSRQRLLFEARRGLLLSLAELHAEISLADMSTAESSSAQRWFIRRLENTLSRFGVRAREEAGDCEDFRLDRHTLVDPAEGNGPLGRVTVVAPGFSMVDDAGREIVLTKAVVLPMERRNGS